MADTIAPLNKAILARIRGTEVLTGDFAAAQAALIAKIPTWRIGSMRRDGAMPSGNIWEDAGVDAMPRAPDIGIVTYSVRRFELWSKTEDERIFTEGAHYLERLFDVRQGAPDLQYPGDGRVWDFSLFVGLQGPHFDDQINGWYASMAFSFVEARP